MNRKVINIILKVFYFTLLMFLLTNFTKAYAIQDIETIIERNYDEIEIDGEIFYTRKDLFTPENTHVGFGNSREAQKEENQEIVKIINEKIKESFEQFTLENYPIEKRISEKLSLLVHDIYSTSDENPYQAGDDIVALVMINAKPVQGDSNYWQENFSKNELHYNVYDKEYSVTMYYFVRLSINSETGDYEVVYMGLEPENFEERLTELEEKGINLRDLDIDKVVNTKYTDEITVVPSSESTATSVEKTEYNSSQIEEISHTANIIRIVCIGLLIIIVLIGIIKVWRK